MFLFVAYINGLSTGVLASVYSLCCDFVLYNIVVKQLT